MHVSSPVEGERGARTLSPTRSLVEGGKGFGGPCAVQGSRAETSGLTAGQTGWRLLRVGPHSPVRVSRGKLPDAQRLRASALGGWEGAAGRRPTSQ